MVGCWLMTPKCLPIKITLSFCFSSYVQLKNALGFVLNFVRFVCPIFTRLQVCYASQFPFTLLLIIGYKNPYYVYANRKHMFEEISTLKRLYGVPFLIPTVGIALNDAEVYFEFRTRSLNSAMLVLNPLNVS